VVAPHSRLVRICVACRFCWFWSVLPSCAILPGSVLGPKAPCLEKLRQTEKSPLPSSTTLRPFGIVVWAKGRGRNWNAFLPRAQHGTLLFVFWMAGGPLLGARVRIRCPSAAGRGLRGWISGASLRCLPFPRGNRGKLFCCGPWGPTQILAALPKAGGCRVLSH